MLKQLEVNIRHGTWPPSGTPAFPGAFHAGSASFDIDISSTLLLIGLLTTPTVTAGVSMSELWAWVRYYYAVADTPDLRLTRDFAELDSHQKTILSDDFGMGFPMSWLIGPLDLVACCDGREFIDRYSALTLPVAAVPKKRGPSKSPDFICLDIHGRLHVVECKGTQSGPNARERQMAHLTTAGEPSGGIVQKRMVVIQPSHQGQSLACGIAIEREDSARSSSLLIVDPEGDERILVRDDDLLLARDPIIRSSIARALRAAGLPISASVVASPSGRRPDARADTRTIARRSEQRRRTFTEERRQRARAELSERPGTQSFQKRKEHYLGRVVELSLPKPLRLGGKMFNRIDIRQGVRRDLLDEVVGSALEDMPMEEAAPNVKGRLEGFKLFGEGETAELSFGEIFASDLRLRP